MAEKHRETRRQEGTDHLGGAELNGTGPSAAQSLAGRFDPFHDPYLADPYSFFAEARADHQVADLGQLAALVEQAFFP